MSKQSSNNKISIADLIQLFQTVPEQAYQHLISVGHYFNTKQTKNFWDGYIQLDQDNLSKQFPDSVPTFNKVIWLKLFYDLNEIYKIEKKNCLEQIVALNPSHIAIIKSFFLCVELGETNSEATSFPNYSLESLESIKLLLKEIYPHLTPQNQSEYSDTLFNYSNNLIKVQLDISLIEDFLDAFVWADFCMSEKENKKGFLLSISDNKSKTDNLFILNQLKTLVKRDFNRSESHPKISQEEHFKLNDPKWKTHEGLATIIHSSNVIIKSQTPGTTSLQVENSMLTDMTSEDPIKKEDALIKMTLHAQEQNFQYQYRQALSQIYQPNDEIDIHALHLQVEPNVYISLYDILCAMSCLIAKADSFRYISDFENGSIKSFKNKAKFLLKKNNPLRTEEEINSSIDAYIIKSLPEIEQQYDIKSFNFIEHNSLINWFRQIEELNKKTTQELDSILNLFSRFDSPLPFNPLYKVGEQFYLSYKTCCEFNLNQILYDNYISDKLFNPNNKIKDERPLIEETQKNREVRFTNSLKDLFKIITPFAEARLEFGSPNSNYDFGDLKGEFDMIAYFEKENIIFPIQVKLSNVSPRTEKRKEEWITKRIREKGIYQVVKDVKLLQSKSGLKFVADKLKIEKGIGTPKIYPLILTDNFFADHHSFKYNEVGDKVFCISYFELKHLIRNHKVHDKQQILFVDANNKPAAQLIELIEQNTFWNFINEFANVFQYKKTLSVVNEEFRIEMKV